jgi:hypothetical protein
VQRKVRLTQLLLLELACAATSHSSVAQLHVLLFLYLPFAAHAAAMPHISSGARAHCADWMACSGCSSSTASTQVLVRQLAEGASPQGWQLDHTSERGDFSPFTLRVCGVVWVEGV